jgi:hypothetical protein
MPWKPGRKVQVYFYSLTSALDKSGWSTTRSGRFTLGKENRYPLYRRLGGRQSQSGRVRKISPPPGFDPRTVQPVASHYTDWANPAQKEVMWMQSCPFPHHKITWVGWGAEVQIRSFLTSTQDDEWPASCSGRFSTEEKPCNPQNKRSGWASQSF